jgi:regulator of replication initiation timing
LQITKLEQKLNELEQSANELIKENKSLKVQRFVLSVLLVVFIIL